MSRCIQEKVEEQDGDSRQSTSADVQESAEAQSSDTPSLNDNSVPIAEEKQEVSGQPVVDSAESGQAPVAKNIEEQKAEIKEGEENANS